MGQWHNNTCYMLYVDGRLRELRAEAARERQARQVRGPRRGRPLRAQVGRLLIVAGEALARQPLDAACPERA